MTVDPRPGPLRHSSPICRPAITRRSSWRSRIIGSTGRRARRPTAVSSDATTAAARQPEHSVPGHNVEPKRVQLGWWSEDERLLQVRYEAPRRDGEGFRPSRNSPITACATVRFCGRALHGNPTATIEPFSWGYRNGYAIRFAPENHPLQGG